jgi:hypothetical protein
LEEARPAEGNISRSKASDAVDEGDKGVSGGDGMRIRIGTETAAKALAAAADPNDDTYTIGTGVDVARVLGDGHSDDSYRVVNSKLEEMAKRFEDHSSAEQERGGAADLTTADISVFSITTSRDTGLTTSAFGVRERVISE